MECSNCGCKDWAVYVQVQFPSVFQQLSRIPSHTTPDFVRLCWLGSVNTWISSKISSLSANLIQLRIVRAINHFSGQGASHDWDTLKTGMLSDLIARVGCLFSNIVSERYTFPFQRETCVSNILF